MRFNKPVKIIDVKGNVENIESLFIDKALQIGMTGEASNLIIKGKARIILDFGKEIGGGVRILTYDIRGNNQIRLRFGESVSETLAEIGEKNATNDHSTRDLTVSLQTMSDLTFGQTGFRFLNIDFLDENGYFEIKTIRSAENSDTREFIGDFECDDPLINEIFSVAKHTLRLCLQNGYFWDGIKRDRLVWIGDLYPEMLAGRCLFGNVKETISSLEFSKETTPLPNWISTMPAYSLWWIINAYDEYFYSGNADFIVKTADYTYGIIKMVNDLVNENGFTNFPSDFIDWPTAYLEGESENRKEDRLTGMRYLTLLCAKKAKEILTIANYDFSDCDNIISKLGNAKNEVKEYKQIAGLGVLTGDLNENNLKVLLKDGANGLSTFMSYPILKGISAFGRHNDAIEIMKAYYGGMLSVGATSFWEDFDIKWLENCYRIDEMPVENKIDIHGDYGAYCYKGFRHSFCHGWSAGVIPYLIEEIAGIKIAQVGCKKIEIKPNLANLTYVNAKFPTPFGVIEVKHEKVNGEIKTSINAPQGIEIIK